MSKFSINQLMNDKSKNETIKEPTAFKIENIHFTKIRPSPMNKYNISDVTELKASIELIGLQQNLLVRLLNNTDEYEIISGHRRFKAICELVREGNDIFQNVPCKIIRTLDDIQAELQLIFANSTSRQLTDYEKTYQAGRLKELLTELKNSGFKFTGRTREVVADLLKVSPAQVGRMESINNNLLPEFKEEFKNGNINITTAYELSKQDEEQQQEVLQKHKSGEPLNPEIVRQHKEKPEQQTQSKPYTVTHELKTMRDVFYPIQRGAKTFEFRFNDKGFKVGDILRLNETIREKNEFKSTGSHIDVKVTYVLNGGVYGIPVGYVVMSIVKL